MHIATDEVDTGIEADPDAVFALRARTDSEAFGLLYHRYVHPVASYFLLRTGNREDAEDLTSQLFEQAFRALPRFRTGDGSVRSWLFTIAHNLTVSYYRSFRSTDQIDSIALQDRARPLEDGAIQEDDLLNLRKALATLTVDQRQVIELRLAGLSGSEISKALGKSHAAVRMLQQRAIQSLRGTLTRPEATNVR